MKASAKVGFWLIFFVFLVFSAQAQFTFITNADNTITITSYTGSDSKVNILSTINGYQVTAIGDMVFNGPALMSVIIPDTITNISIYAFWSCYGLTNIAVDSANPCYASADGVLFNKSMTTLVQCPGGFVGSYVISSSINSIGTNAFASCLGLTSVTIPNSVTSIGDYAFLSCEGLTNVLIGNNVGSIGNSAFWDCVGLTSVTIPNSVTNVSHYAFYACSQLTQVFFQGNAPSVDGVDGITDSTIFHDAYRKSGTVYFSPSTTGWGTTFGGLPTAQYIPPPPLGISAYSAGSPAVFFPTATGTNFVLQMTTNLTSGNWTAITSGVPISGFIINNLPSNAFFRLH